ncbi:MAG: arsenosugar biosynthesis radical SAM protein ArsS [Verrucomicrobiales bacterium]|nr:arsenosugar biosynthesis radical SAM protein ArsS [Verrucomicrobiales bacterium]
MPDTPLLFAESLARSGRLLTRGQPEILQLNVGKRCNLTCIHCHVNAGPNRREIIAPHTVDRVLGWFESAGLPVLDLTGGSPEMVPDFRRIIRTVRQFCDRRRIIDRLNATILDEPGYDWVAEFLAEHEVEIVASMPCYEPANVNAQRGDGVFDRSISAFQKLNTLGYGTRPELTLNFVYNPNGAFLPGPQAELEADYRRAMREHFGIEFNRLYTITNMPISRFAAWLRHSGQLEAYLELLRAAFNPQTVDGLMCRNTINVSWQGEVFDCDFNQMLDLHPTGHGDREPLFLWDVDPDNFTRLPIRTGNHCFGCTAGCGSSCGGALV